MRVTFLRKKTGEGVNTATVPHSSKSHLFENVTCQQKSATGVIDTHVVSASQQKASWTHARVRCEHATCTVRYTVDTETACFGHIFGEHPSEPD